MDLKPAARLLLSHLEIETGARRPETSERSAALLRSSLELASQAAGLAPPWTPEPTDPALRLRLRQLVRSWRSESAGPSTLPSERKLAGHLLTELDRQFRVLILQVQDRPDRAACEALARTVELPLLDYARIHFHKDRTLWSDLAARSLPGQVEEALQDFHLFLYEDERRVVRKFAGRSVMEWRVFLMTSFLNRQRWRRRKRLAQRRGGGISHVSYEQWTREAANGAGDDKGGTHNEP